VNCERWNYDCTDFNQCITSNNWIRLQELSIAIGLITLSLKAVKFWTVLRIYCHVPSSASQIKPLAVRSLTLSAPPAVVCACQSKRISNATYFGAYSLTTTNIQCLLLIADVGLLGCNTAWIWRYRRFRGTYYLHLQGCIVILINSCLAKKVRAFFKLYFSGVCFCCMQPTPQFNMYGFILQTLQRTVLMFPQHTSQDSHVPAVTVGN
jgi:hypothetical protein